MLDAYLLTLNKWIIIEEEILGQGLKKIILEEEAALSVPMVQIIWTVMEI